MKTDDGGPAFSRTAYIERDVRGNITSEVEAQDGMSLRDYFAAQALAGLIAAHTGEMSLPVANHAARDAYEFADAMIVARRK